MTAPRYAMLTEGMARKMKVERLEKIIEEAIGIDLAPAEYLNLNAIQRIVSLGIAKARYWERMQSRLPAARSASPEILPAAEVNAWLRSLPEQVQP